MNPQKNILKLRSMKYAQGLLYCTAQDGKGVQLCMINKKRICNKKRKQNCIQQRPKTKKALLIESIVYAPCSKCNEM